MKLLIRLLSAGIFVLASQFVLAEGTRSSCYKVIPETPLKVKLPPGDRGISALLQMKKLSGIKTVEGKLGGLKKLSEKHDTSMVKVQIVPGWLKATINGIAKILPSKAGAYLEEVMSSIPMFVSVSDPKLIEEVFKKPQIFTRPYDQGFFVEVLGPESIFVQLDEGKDAEAWDLVHGVMIPEFRPKHISETYAPLFTLRAEEVVQNLVSKSKEGRIEDVTDQINYYTTSAVAQDMLGLNMSTGQAGLLQFQLDRIFVMAASYPGGATALVAEEQQQINKIISGDPAAQSMYENMRARELEEAEKNRERIDKTLERLKEKKRENSKLGMERNFHKRGGILFFVENMIAERRKLMEERGGALPQDMMQALLNAQAENDLPDSWVEAQLITLMFAGQETTSSFAKWAAYELARHPNFVKLVRSTDTDKAKTQLVNNFLREVLRVHPVVPSLMRFVRGEKPVQLGEYVLPPNTIVETSSWINQTDPKIWGSDANTFDPLRFGRFKPERGSFFPFGLGRRVCIGQMLAMMETNALIMELINTVDLSLPEGFVPTTTYNGASMHMAEELPLIIEARK